MPCAICNDAITVDREDPKWTAAQTRSSAKQCSYCRIIVEVLDERKIHDNQVVYYRSDDRYMFTRNTNGITVCVGHRFESYTELMFMIRSLKG